MALETAMVTSTAITASGVLSLLSLRNIRAIFDLYQMIRQWLPGQSDLYEILDYESTLELCNAKGTTARFQKRQRIKFLQNNIIAFEDYVWGEGEVMADYQCSPGVVADRYQESDRWNILISLRETKNKGDITEFHIERLEKDSFLKADEWQQTEIRRKTRRLQMNIIFPKNRRCQHATLLQRRYNRKEVLGPNHFHELPDGRQLLTWESTRIYPYDVFTIRWRW